MPSKYLLLVLGFLSSSLLFSQSKDTASFPYWIEMMQDPDANFYATQKAFNKYWDGRTQQKGNGFKAFKRWEWFMELEVNPDGSYQSRADLEREYQNFKTTYGPITNLGNISTQSVGGTWTNLGPIDLPTNGTGQPNGMGRVNCVGLHPTDTAVIIVGASNGGIWRTVNHGQTWSSNSDTLVSMQVSNIRFDPLDPNIVYAGTGDRDAGNRSQAGVLKSTNAGVSWVRKNSGMGNRTVGMIAIHPTQPDTIIAATNGGIYRSLNGADSWTRVSSNTRHYKDILFMPNNPSIAYATEGGKFYRSANYGASWTQITSGIPTGTRGVIGVTEDDSTYVYFLLCQGSVFKGMYRSTDGGLSFSTRSTTPNIMDYSTTGSGNSGQAWYDLDMAVDPNDKNTVYGAGINIFKSTDGGATWQINADWVGRGVDAIHADQHALEYSADKKRLYAGCDGGIYYSQNGNNWTDLSDGVAISEVYKIGQSRYNPDLVICGYQDNGTAVYYGSNSWTTEIGGDGMECVVDPSDDNYMYGALYYGNMRRSSNNGTSFGTIAANGVNGITESGAWVTPYALHENDPNTMFIGYRNLWRSENVKANGNGNVSWTKISNSLGGTNNSTLRVLEQSQANDDIFYMGRADRKLFVSTNINDTTPTWTDLTANLPQNSIIADLECHPFLDSVVYMLQNRDIYKSEDLGQSWTNISGNLPNISLRSLVYDEYSSEGIYVAGTPGVYYKDSSMTNWVSFLDGLPTDVSVTELEIQYDTTQPALSLIRAATYGRGLWSSDLYDDGTNKPIAAFGISDETTCVGNTVSLESRSAYLPSAYQWSISPSNYTIQSGSLSAKQLSIRLDTSAYFNVQLIATNGNGSDTLLKTNLVQAIDTSTSATCVTTTRNMTSRYGIGIGKFKIGDFENYSSVFDGQNSNVDFTCGGLIELEADSSYAIEVETGGSNDEYADVYLDYNGDGDFTDAGEQISSMARARRYHYDTIRTSSSPLFNTYLRLRVVSDFSNIQNDPCRFLNYGESEDYLVYFNFSDAELTASADTICFGDTLVFQADSVVGRIDSLTWSFGNGASPSVATGTGPHTVVYNAPGQYQASLKVNDKTPKTRMISVAGIPSLSLTSPDTSLCDQDSLSLLLRDTLQANQNTIYRWKRNGSSVPAQGDTLIQRNAAQWFDEGSYQVYAYNMGCRDTSELVEILVNPIPQSSIVLLSDTSQCFDVNEFELAKSSTVSRGSLQSTWKVSNGLSSNTDSLLLNFNLPGLKSIQIFDTSDAACADSSSLQIEVLESPLANFILDTGLCFDGHLVELADLSNANDLASRNWNLGDGNLSQDSNLTYSYQSIGVYDLSLAIELNNACKDTLSKSIEIYTSPDASFSQNDSVFCLGVNELQLNSTGAAVPNQNFQWELGDGTSSQDSSFTHVFNLPGVYSIKLKLNTDKACADSSNSQVEILDDPEASFSFTNTAIATYSFEATDTNLTSYLWNFGDGNTDTSFNVIHIYATNGSYPVTLEVSDTNTCVDSSSQSIQLENVGLGVLSNLGFVIYPNPSSGEVYLKNLNAEYGEMKIYDQLGKVISNIAISSAERQIELPILSVGTYIVEIRASSFYRSKLVVH